jgi:glycosyltransferase involved in cell wall biosynthesis
VTAAVTVDVAGGPTGGAARYRAELYRYLARSGRDDVQVIGANRRVRPAWLLRREVPGSARDRRVALNNVGFVTPGGERWTLLRNALHFLTEPEMSRLDSSLRSTTGRKAAVVRLAARRSDVLVTPSSAMAERVTGVLPSVRGRVVVRLHPVSADAVPRLPRTPAILCPVLFRPYKHMVARLKELLTVIEEYDDPAVRLLVTAGRGEVPADVARHPRIELLGQLRLAELSRVWARSRAIYFPTGLESFGYPLADARAAGHPVIARDTAQSREIAGPALCGFTPGDAASLRRATALALTTDVAPDPEPFDPDAYFSWLLGPPR